MAVIARIVSLGTGPTSRVELDNGDIITNVVSAKWEINGFDKVARVTLELEGVNVEVNDARGAAFLIKKSKEKA